MANQLVKLAIPDDNLFNEKKTELEEFSKQIPEQAILPTVPIDGGLFYLFDHNVTGTELNNVTGKIQSFMIEQNKTLVTVMQEFATIYDTFSALDKVYLKKILSTLNVAIKANNKANESIEQINMQQKKISSNQQDIKQLIDTQKQTIQVLKNFKEKLEKIQHLTDVDKIHDNNLDFQAKIKTLEQFYADQKKNAEKLSDEQAKLSKYFCEKNADLEQVLNDISSKYESVQDELATLRNENVGLLKSLLIAKGVSIASLALSLVFLVLFLTGALR
jgi:hypothetical protein